MCMVLSFIKDNSSVLSHFSDKQITIPTRAEFSNENIHEIWGRRKTEFGVLPFGGWIAVESAKSKRWLAYNPSLVKVLAKKFMVKNTQNIAEWFDVPDGQCIYGLTLKINKEKRVYIITTTQQTNHMFYLLWPMLVYL
jgi:hypothetical protein